MIISVITMKFVGIYPEKDVMQRKGEKILEALRFALRDPVLLHLTHAMSARTKGWSDTPDFEGRMIDTTQRLGIEIVPKGLGSKRWRWVSLGTKPHTISPKRKGYLTIKWGHTSFTKPGNIYGRTSGGTYSGPFIRSSRPVHHPGIRPRLFEENIVRDDSKEVEAILLAAAVRGAL